MSSLMYAGKKNEAFKGAREVLSQSRLHEQGTGRTVDSSVNGVPRF